MRIGCPFCGERDLREFTVRGAAVALDRPGSEAGAEAGPEAGEAAWDAYLHLRDNPAGETRELWYHDPCGAWVVVTRDTVSHAVRGTVAAEAPR